jgi:hypothetical protein
MMYVSIGLSLSWKKNRDPRLSHDGRGSQFTQWSI